MTELTTDLIDTVNKIIVDYFIGIIAFFIICILAIPAVFLNNMNNSIEKKTINFSFNILITLIIICTYLFLLLSHVYLEV